MWKHVRAVTENCDIFVIAKYMPQRHMPPARGLIYINQNKVLSSSNRFLSFVLAFRRFQGRYSIGIWRLKCIGDNAVTSSIRIAQVFSDLVGKKTRALWKVYGELLKYIINKKCYSM